MMDAAAPANHSVGTQAGIFDTQVVASFVLELLEKCREINDVFKQCQEDLVRSHDVIDKNEQVVHRLQATVDKFGSTMDSLGLNLLSENMTLAKVNEQIDKVKREIAVKKNIMRHQGRQYKHVELWDRVNELRREREKLETQLRKVNADIDTKYEEVYNAEEKLANIKELRAQKQEEFNKELESLQEATRDIAAKKRELLKVTPDDMMDMSQFYVSPGEFRRLLTEIEDMRHQQVQVDRHIEMQLEEREFLHETADDVSRRVQDLEKQVRKETGDHCWESALTAEPNWYPDFTTPTMWYTAPPLTVNQIKWLRERQNRKYATVAHGAHGSDDESSDDDGHKIEVSKSE